jgi:hypothetical protein
MVVYIVCQIDGSEDGIPVENILTVTDTIELAKLYIHKLVTMVPYYKDLITRVQPINSNMTVDNNFTSVDDDAIGRGCGWGKFGGFVIREYQVVNSPTMLESAIDKQMNTTWCGTVDD